MKISNILFAFIAFVGLGLLASCEMNDEFYEELDKEPGFQLVENLDYTLTDDDYADLGDDAKKYGSFSKYDPAADHLPAFLDEKYPTLDLNSTINVTYKFYQGSLDYIRDYEDLNYLQLTEDDYDSMGEGDDEPGEHDNFAYNIDPNDYLPDFLAGVYPEAESGFTVEVNYKYYANWKTSIVSDFWAFDGSVWANAAYATYELTSEDYDSMGEGSGEPGSHDNFAYYMDLNDYLPAFLSGKYPDAPTNALVYVTYKYYNNNETNDVSEYWAFDGTTWTAYNPDIVVPDGITRYDLTEEDYNAMGFDEMFESEDDTNVLPTFMKVNFPYAVSGDVYTIVFKYMDDDKIVRGAVEITKNDDVWEVYQSTIEKTDQYVRSTAGWVYDPSVHYTMIGDDYQIIVDYVNDNIGSEYLDSYGTAESYYGAGSYHENFGIREGDYDASFATWEDAVKEAMKTAFLPNRFPDAAAQVDGVDVNYVITFATYSGSDGTYFITFKCTKSGPNPEFEYVEGPTEK